MTKNNEKVQKNEKEEGIPGAIDQKMNDLLKGFFKDNVDTKTNSDRHKQLNCS